MALTIIRTILYDIKRIEIKPNVDYGPIKPYELQYRGQVYINYEI